MKIKIQEYRKEMRKYRSRRDDYGVQNYNEARWEFLKLLEKQEVYWNQRAKQLWLKKGDQNTRFFHNYASGRKRHNQLTRLKNKNGVWKENREDIRAIITEYFEELFQATTLAGGLSEREVINRVTEEQKHKLLIPVTHEKVKEAGFYQAYWSIVGNDVVKFCQSFFLTGELSDGINRTMVCLIPKTKHPHQMTDIRPISLCNVLFRILSKVMANRLKQCLPSLISDKQSAFIEGRLPTDNALIAFELNHYIRRKTQGVNGVVGLKLDFSKAYDRLEWIFFENMLQKFCFNSDGTEFGNIRPKRGIRQGDPISPYLYILRAEGLSSIIRRYEEAGLVHGCSIARGAPPISHLFFVDDCYVFFKATVQEARSMKSILERYERLSGHAINLMKSMVTFSPNTEDTCRLQICTTLQVQESALPGNYLGLPMYIGRRKNNAFKFLTERRQMNAFWWGNGGRGKGIRWLAWERLCEGKQNGGLGFRDLKKFNVAMLAKQGWRLLNGDNALVTNLMKAKYYSNSNFLDATLGVNPNYMWRSILQSQNINGYLTTIMPNELQNVQVANLMTKSGNGWDDEILKDIFNDRDIELINSIPISRNILLMCYLGAHLQKMCGRRWESRRNRWVWGKIIGSDFGVHAAAINLLIDWKRSQLEKQSCKPVVNSNPRSWSPPPHGWVKINIDAKNFEANESVGLSSIIRNEAGQFIRARAQRISAKMQPREAEAVHNADDVSWCIILMTLCFLVRKYREDVHLLPGAKSLCRTFAFVEKPDEVSVRFREKHSIRTPTFRGKNLMRYSPLLGAKTQVGYLLRGAKT
ncbi:uncharacterized protein LOC141686447 [Apium graveolens]|uniref:uncharacterized protein LOC141686447 n=1 Tax=Apium graveolens TaxID=4045 RepID=UPI003D7B7D71